MCLAISTIKCFIYNFVHHDHKKIFQKLNSVLELYPVFNFLMPFRILGQSLQNLPFDSKSIFVSVSRHFRALWKYYMWVRYLTSNPTSLRHFSESVYGDKLQMGFGKFWSGKVRFLEFVYFGRCGKRSSNPFFWI